MVPKLRPSLWFQNEARVYGSKTMPDLWFQNNVKFMGSFLSGPSMRPYGSFMVPLGSFRRSLGVLEGPSRSCRRSCGFLQGPFGILAAFFRAL